MRELRLLSVDDDRLMASIICHIAQGAGFFTRTCTGQSIHIAYDSFKPDVVVLDILMPDMDGFEVLKFLDDRKSEAHIVIVSGGSTSYRRMAESLGNGLSLTIAASVTKPFEHGEIRDVFENIRKSLIDPLEHKLRKEPPKDRLRQAQPAALRLPKTNSS